MSSADAVHNLHALRPLRDGDAIEAGATCSSLAPGHAVNLTGVKRALALAHDPHRAPVEVRVTGVTGEYVILALTGGPLVARTHAAQRLSGLVAAASAAGERLVGRFTAHEHQLLIDVGPDVAADTGTVFLAPSRPTGAVVAFNLALPWHPGEPCVRATPGSVAPRATIAAAGARR